MLQKDEKKVNKKKEASPEEDIKTKRTNKENGCEKTAAPTRRKRAKEAETEKKDEDAGDETKVRKKDKTVKKDEAKGSTEGVHVEKGKGRKRKAS